MITYDEVLNMNYYAKAAFHGWVGGMRFRISKETDEAGGAVFRVYAWPGPYIFEKTADECKICTDFPFTEEGRCACVDWLNAQLTEHAELWPQERTAGVWKKNAP